MSLISMQPRSASETVKPISLGGWKARTILQIPLLVSFTAMYWLILGAFFLPTAWKIYQARRWVQTPCVILVSWVTGRQGAYLVNVRFSYYDTSGRKHFAQGYNFGQQSSKTRGHKQRIVDDLPSGSYNSCFVNPNDPAEAIFRRDADFMYWVAGALMLIGPWALAGFLWVVLWRRKAEILRDYWQDVMTDLWPCGPEKATHGEDGPLKADRPVDSPT
jgi:hypothetical protein